MHVSYLFLKKSLAYFIIVKILIEIVRFLVYKYIDVLGQFLPVKANFILGELT